MPRHKKKKKKRAKRPSHHEIYNELKLQRRNRRILRPGKWSGLVPRFSVAARLKKNAAIGLGEYIGKYITHDDGYTEDGYRARVKISVDNHDLLVKTHGMDQLLAACEKSLNSYKYKSGKKVLGDVVIMELLHDEKSKREKYLPCLIKTSKRHLPKFMGLRKDKNQIKPRLQVF